jgi:hypothetical protein
MSQLVLPPEGTLLVLTPISGFEAPQLTPYSARNLTQNYETIGIDKNWIKRDVNGTLRSVADVRFRKYKSTITCQDGQTPALDNAWIGVTCEVSCAFEFSYLIGGIAARPMVPHSDRVDSGYVFYRPILLMIVMGIKNAFREWGAINDWSVELEEV